MQRAAVRNLALFERARRDFGGWAQALRAAGIATPARRGRTARGAKPVRHEHLSERLLRSDCSNQELSRRTGVDRKTIREMRRRRGISRAPGTGLVDPFPSEAALAGQRRAWKAPSRMMLLREKALALPAKRRQEMLAGMDARSAAILTRRCLSKTPLTLADLAVEYGVSRERIRQIEDRAARAALARLSRY